MCMSKKLLSLEYNTLSSAVFFWCTINEVSDAFDACMCTYLIFIDCIIWALSDHTWKLCWSLISSISVLLCFCSRGSFCMFTLWLAWKLQNSLLEFLEILSRLTSEWKVLLVACAENFWKLWFVLVQILVLFLFSAMLWVNLEEDIFTLHAQ